jgi:hypothetical protein
MLMSSVRATDDEPTYGNVIDIEGNSTGWRG